MNTPTWDEIGENLLWHLAVTPESIKCDYGIIDTDEYESQGYPKGSIVEFAPWIHPSQYHMLTWKELYVLMGGKHSNLFVPDMHDCKRCANNNVCTSCVKDDSNYERCDDWKLNN